MEVAIVLGALAYAATRRKGCDPDENDSACLVPDPTVNVVLYPYSRGRERHFLRNGNFTQVAQHGRIYHYKLPTGHWIAANKDWRVADAYEKL